MPDPLAGGQRRRALRLGLMNGALWSIGNSLTSGPLVYYLAIDLGAAGRQLGLLLALPALAGLLRMFTPALIARLGTAKAACLTASTVAYLVLLGLPLTGFIAADLPQAGAISLLIAVICVHQLLEYIGLVALWAWFADLVPLRIRGRYFARRQMLQLAVTIPAALAAGYFSDLWREHYKSMRGMMLLGYAVPNALGAFFLLGSLAPLVRMPATRYLAWNRAIPWGAMTAPFRDFRFQRLLAFRTWFSLASGISQTAQSAFPKVVLGLGAGDLAVMSTAMRVGQIGVARLVGPFSDRYGNRPVLVACQVFVSAAMFFYLFASGATVATAWLILGAWLLWAAYAGHNVCLPNLALKLAPAEEKSPYVAAVDALASLAYAAATVAGGFLFDWLAVDWFGTEAGVQAAYTAVFLIALVARFLAVPLAACIDEPGATRWPQILAADRARIATPMK